MLSDDRAHAISTGHSVLVMVRPADYNAGPYGSVLIDWMCCACPSRGSFGASR